MSKAVAEVLQAMGETPPEEGETLAEFKRSFAYGSRTDLLFKFIKNLSDRDAAEFIRSLLEKLGETLDDGNLERLTEHVVEWNARAYAHEWEDRWRYDTGPFAPLTKPLAECRLGLLTATGHFVEGDDPAPLGEAGLTQEEAIPRILEFARAEPILSAIPFDTPPERLRARHPGIDIRAYVEDPNVAFPLERLREFVAEGVIGELLPAAYSFVGITAQTSLLKKEGPAWAERFRDERADAMLLVPV